MASTAQLIASGELPATRIGDAGHLTESEKVSVGLPARPKATGVMEVSGDTSDEP